MIGLGKDFSNVNRHHADVYPFTKMCCGLKMYSTFDTATSGLDGLACSGWLSGVITTPAATAAVSAPPRPADAGDGPSTTRNSRIRPMNQLQARGCNQLKHRKPVPAGTGAASSV